MIINIKVKNFELTSSIKEYIEIKLKYLEKFLVKELEEGSVMIDFEVAKTTRHHKKGNIFYAEANLKIMGTVLRAEKTSDDLLAAIDKVKDILAEEIKRFKSSRNF